MSNRQHLDGGLFLPIENSKREASQDKLPATVLARRPASGCCYEKVHRPIQLNGKLVRRGLVPLQIPAERRFQFR
jgi:hypothetical protein